MNTVCHLLSRKATVALLALLLSAFPALAQKVAVTGTVYDPDGEPAIGASVMIEGTSQGVATDFDGNFTLEMNPQGTIVVSYVGAQTQTIALDGRTNVEVHLQTSGVNLDELVVIGYGAVKKSDATGSVAVIKPDEITAGLSTSAQDMLVGASPGVVVTTDGGNPSGGASITIRGGASLSASNEPLIVIDGVPMDRNTVVGSSNPLSLISPENVESMTILKDASATAIYGSRASNGVIIITTKRGQAGKPQVNFSANVHVNTPRNYMNVMDGDMFADFIRKTYGEGSVQVQKLGADGKIYNTDWQKEVLRSTVSSEYNLSVGGTVGPLPYRAAIGYTNNNGIIKTTSMDRATGSLNLTPKFFDDLLSLQANIKGGYIRNSYSGGGLGEAVSFNPTLPVHMQNVFNNYTTYIDNGWLAGPNTPGTAINYETAPYNPAASINDYSSKSNVWQSVGNLMIDLKMPFLPELRANLNLGFEYNHGECVSYRTPFSQQAWASGHNVPDSDTVVKDGYTGKNTEHQVRKNLLLDFYLNYAKEFEAIRSALDVTAGYSWQKFDQYSKSWYRVNAPGQPFNDYQHAPTSYGSKPYQLLSFFGRLQYTFDDKYLLTATVRRDGTSRFSKDHRWGTFPAVALGWKILDEDFMEDARGWMTELKLRGGWGITGQQDLNEDYFPYLPVYYIWTGMGSRYPNPLGNGYVYPIVPSAYNSNIKWEETTTWNVGLDFAFLNNRISGNIEWYKRKTKDLLTYANYAAGSNLSNMGNLNLGDLENTGIEFNITTRPVVTQEFTWTSAFNIGWNKNKITRLADGADTTTGGIGTAGNVMKHVEGYPAYSFWVYEQVYDKNGNPLEGVVVDRNGDGAITQEDRYLYHSKDPAVTATWNNNFNYKNWDLGFSLRGNFGNWVYNYNEMNNVFASLNDATTKPLTNLIQDRYLWTTDRTTEKMQSDYWVRNASFVRCDNITLGYTWPELLDDHLRLRLYGAVQNPFVITKYKGLDPEVGWGIDNSVYPRPITFTLGLVATF